ncbi:MAG: hypothetical protein KDC67_02245 [Ignavibacteriae bacterium]|nr:hypothetical protein [Ignavibacteriota bacterium]
MKKIIAFASLLFISLYTSGQITTATGSSNINDVLFITRSSIKGTPFFKDEWMNGKYVTNNGSFSDNKFLVYNVYTNYLFEKNGSNPQDAIALNSNDISGFVLVDKSQNYIFKKIESDKFLDNNRDTKFYLLIEPTSDKVIIEPNKTFKDPNSSGWT